MYEKFDIYDLLGVLVPGVLVVCLIPLSFPELADALASATLPEEFAFVGLVAASTFIGYLIQAIASLIDEALNRTWGGRPSERALDGGLSDRYFPADTASRIRACLSAAAGASASSRSLFLFAMQLAETGDNPRVLRFNALYAYHRALIVLNISVLVLFMCSFWGGLATHLSGKHNTIIIVTLVLLLAILWHRTRQRAFYYAREVLLTAERVLKSNSSSTPATAFSERQ